MDRVSSEEWDAMRRHRELVLEAENDRLNGETTLSPEELDEKIEALFAMLEP